MLKGERRIDDCLDRSERVLGEVRLQVDIFTTEMSTYQLW